MTSDCAFTYEQLLDYTDGEAERWQAWLASRPAALDVPFAEGRLATVRGLIIHIFAVELRYAQRLLGENVIAYEDIHAHSVSEIFELGHRARRALRESISMMTDEAAADSLTFQTITAGTITASRRKIASNTFLHGIRHWAQIATTLRAAGFDAQWGHDMLLSQTRI